MNGLVIVKFKFINYIYYVISNRVKMIIEFVVNDSKVTRIRYESFDSIAQITHSFKT